MAKNHPRSLEGVLCLVTGGGGGIGSAVCQLFSEEGGRVAVADIDLTGAKRVAAQLRGSLESSPKTSGEAASSGLSSLHSSYFVDVSDSKSVTTLGSAIIDRYRETPQVVVQCAGTLPKPVGLLACSEDLFDQTFNIELRGTFLVLQHFVKLMVQRGLKWGSLITISSIAAKGVSGSPHFAAAKAGLEAFTKSVALEFGPKGIRANVIQPGLVDTPMLWETFKENPTGVQVLEQETPLRRIAKPKEVAQMCLFLASQSTGSFVTGSVQSVHGGLQL